MAAPVNLPWWVPADRPSDKPTESHEPYECFVSFLARSTLIGFPVWTVGRVCEPIEAWLERRHRQGLTDVGKILRKDRLGACRP